MLKRLKIYKIVNKTDKSGLGDQIECPLSTARDAFVDFRIHILKGTSVMWFNTYFHMHPDLYDNPTVFDPSRWEGNESNTLQDDHWFGFGHGPRACPGTRWAFLTMKMIIIEMIRTYEIVPCDNKPKTIKARDPKNRD